MTRDDEQPTGQASEREVESDLEQLVFECLERVETEGVSALEAIYNAHPEHAAALRERMRMLHSAGLLNGAPLGLDFPESLGDFRLLERLGGGGMGVVYLARQTSLGRDVALKLIRPENLYFQGSRERFKREVEAVARLAHSGIAPVYSVGEERGIPFFAMEHVVGLSLADVLDAFAGREPQAIAGSELLDLVRTKHPTRRGSSETGGSLFAGSWKDVCLRIALAVARALQHAHERGVLHRDVKPSNIMVTASGRIVLLDFGLAVLHGTERLTRTGSQLGSLPYMAPEQVRGEINSIGVRTDVYALGVTLYELLALQAPYYDENAQKTRTLILDGRPKSLREHHRGLPRDVETVCLKAMDADPARRYESTASFADDLENVLSHRPVDARRAGPLLITLRWAQRNPARAAAAALAVLVVVGGPLVFGLQQRAKNRTVQGLNQDLEAALAEAKRQGVLKEEQRATAERNLKKALDAVDQMLTRVGDNKLRHVPQMENVRRELLDDALKYYDAFLQESASSPELIDAAIDARMRAADINGQLSRYERSFELFESAVASMRERQVGPDGERAHKLQLALGLGRMSESKRLIGKVSEGEPYAREALALLTELTDADPKDVKAQLSRGVQLAWLGELYFNSSKLEEAEREFVSSIEVLKTAAGLDPEQWEIQRNLARTLDRFSILKRTTKKQAEAEPASREAVEIFTRLCESRPGDPTLAMQRFNACVNFSNMLQENGQLEEAHRALITTLEVGEHVVRDFPNVRQYRIDLAKGCMNAGGTLFLMKRYDEIAPHFERSEQLARGLLAEAPDDGGLLFLLGSLLAGQAETTMATGSPELAIDKFNEGVALLRGAYTQNPKHPEWSFRFWNSFFNRAWNYTKLKRFADAYTALQEMPDPPGAHWMSSRALLLESCAEGLAADPAQATLAQEVADQTLAALTAAVERGYRKLSVDDPTDWSAVRDRPEFKALLEQVNAAGAAKGN